MIRIDYISAGVDNIKDFFGREKLIQDIKHRLKSHQSVSFFGERKIGKTSLLKYLFQAGIREITFPDAGQVIILYQTFAGKQGLSPESFLQLLQDELKRQMNLPAEGGSIDRYAFESFIKSCYHEGKRFVFFFDEVDAASENRGFDHTFFSYLRSLSEMYRVQYIIASRKSIKQLIFENNVVSPFNGLFSGNIFKLEVFAKEDAAAFCKKLSMDALAGDRIPLDSIIDLAGTHPFLIRLAFFHAINLSIQSAGNRLDYEALKTIFEKESYNAYFYDVWSHMDIEERKLLKDISLSSLPDKLKLFERDMLTDFQNSGLIVKKKTGEYGFVNNYFKEFVGEWEPEKKSVVMEKGAVYWGENLGEKFRRLEESFTLPEKDAKEKGEALEDVVTYLFTNYENYFAVRQSVRSRTSELDIHLWFKPGDDPLLRKFGEEIIVECKNWRQAVGKPEINDLAGDMVARKCKTGILVSRKGITGKDFNDAAGQRLVWFHSEFNLIILILTLSDIKSITGGKDLVDLLKEKYLELVEGG
jgi:hypothetical protein